MQRPEVRELSGGHENLPIHTSAIGNEPPAAAIGRVCGCRRSDHDGDAVAAAIELAGRPDRRQHRDVHLGAIGAADVVDQLVQVVGERVLGVRALMQLREDVAGHGEHRIRGGTAEMHRDPVLPLDLVPEMILVPRRERIVDVELLVRVSEGDRPDLAIQRRAARIATMVVSEGAAGHRIDRRMPRGIKLVIGPDDRVRVVLGLGTIVVRSGRPESEGCGIADGGAVVGRRRIVLARRYRGRHEKDQQGCGFHGFASRSPHCGSPGSDRSHSQTGHSN